MYIVEKKTRLPVIVATDLLFGLGVFIHKLFTRKFFKKESQRSFDKILIINSGFIGDSILNLPLIVNLAKQYPKAQIDMLINPLFKDLWKHVPVHNLIGYKAPWVQYKKKFSFQDLNEYKKIIRKIRSKKYDLIIDTRGDIRNNVFLLYASNAQYRIGYGYTGGSYALTHKITHNKNVHEVKKCYNVLKLLKCPLYEKNPVLETDKPSKDFERYKNKIVLCPFGGYARKEWSSEKWSKLIEQLNKKGITPLIMGGTKDVNKIEYFSGKYIDLVGKLSLSQTATVLSIAKKVIGIDTGPMHVAAAVGTSTISLFGPTNEKRWKPLGNNILIKKKDMKDISVKEVIKSI